MFYIYFIFIILLVFSVLWMGFWLYTISNIKHSAQSLLGKLIRLYDKRHDLIENFINKDAFISVDMADKVADVISLIQSSRKSKNIYDKLKIEHMISETIKCFNYDEGISFDINEEIHLIVEEYNNFVQKLNNLYERTSLRILFKIFKINLLPRIEV